MAEVVRVTRAPANDRNIMIFLSYPDRRAIRAFATPSRRLQLSRFRSAKLQRDP